MFGGAEQSFLGETKPHGLAESIGVIPLQSSGPPAVVISFENAIARRQYDGGRSRMVNYVAPISLGPTDTAALVIAPDSLNHRRIEQRSVYERMTGMSPMWFLIPPVQPYDQAMLAIYPDTLNQYRLRPRQEYERGGAFAPPAFPVGPALNVELGYYPDIVRGQPCTAQLRGGMFVGPFPPTVVQGFGPAGSATFVVNMNAGTKVTYEWSTQIMKAWDGSEYRTALINGPRVRISAYAVLVDGDSRDVRTSIVVNAAQAATFLIGLPYEEVTISAPSSGTTATVNSTYYLDWCLIGQRVLVLGPGGTAVQAVIQSFTLTTINLDQALGSDAGNIGARIMPLLPVLLDPKQGFARYPVAAATWAIGARAALYGWCGTDFTMGIGDSPGVSLTLFADPILGTIAVWDRGVMADASEPAGDSVQTLTDTIDLGGVPAQKGSAPYVDQGRNIRFRSDSIVDWQWLKRFLFYVHGRQIAWLCPSWRVDMVMVSQTTNTITVNKGTTFGDVMQWYNAGLARRLQLVNIDGTTQIVAVTSAIDNGNGTATLGLNLTIAGTVNYASFVDLCRFEDDNFDIEWDAGRAPNAWLFKLDTVARVVQQ